MSHPLDPLTLERLAVTQAWAKRPRKVDMPVVAADSRVRPAEVAAPPGPCPEPEKPAYVTTVATIQRTVAHAFGITVAELVGARRGRNACWPRQAAARIAEKTLPALSLVKLGHEFGGRDHSSIITMLRSIERRLGAQAPLFAEFKAKYRRAEELCRAAFASEATP